MSQDTRAKHGHCHRALVRHGSHLSRNRLNLEPWFCYWLVSALSSLTCLMLKTGAILAGRDTISNERAGDSLTARVLRDASQAWQCTSMIPPFGRLKQEGCLGSTLKTKLNRKAGTAEAQFCQRSLPSCLLGPRTVLPTPFLLFSNGHGLQGSLGCPGQEEISCVCSTNSHVFHVIPGWSPSCSQTSGTQVNFRRVAWHFLL